MRPSSENPFWSEFRAYLRHFLDSQSAVETLSDERTANVLWHEGDEPSSIQLDQEGLSRFRNLLRTAQEAFDPFDDLSRGTIERVLRDVMFALVRIKRERRHNAIEMIENEIDPAKQILEGEAAPFECWIEVDGVDKSSLPAKFGSTEFMVLDDTHVSRLRVIDDATRDVDVPRSDESVLGRNVRITGRTVAIQRVRARDRESARSLAIREVSATLECLNFLRVALPNNRAVVRIGDGADKIDSSIQVALADNGDFLFRPVSRIPWELPLDQLWKLGGLAAVALRRLDALLQRDDRSEVGQLLVRAARWGGRATAADTAEDGFLYSWIAIDCLLRPVSETPVGPTIVNRASSMLRDDPNIQEIKRLYGLRNDLVHDGRLDILDVDIQTLHRFALNLLGRLLANDEVKSLDTLADLGEFYERQVSE